VRGEQLAPRSLLGRRGVQAEAWVLAVRRQYVCVYGYDKVTQETDTINTPAAATICIIVWSEQYYLSLGFPIAPYFDLFLSRAAQLL
jgi:hypothetical protein